MSFRMAVRVAMTVAIGGVVIGAGNGAARAHGLGMSQLRLRLGGANADGEWDVQLRDARLALGLDPALAGDAAWRELRPHEADLRAYLGRQLAVVADGAPCAVAVAPSPMREQTEPPQVTFRLSIHCPAEPVRLGLRCDLLFDRDPAHRAYFSVEDARVTHAGVLRADRRQITLDIHRFSGLQIIIELAREGATHIWSGLDHVLFLLVLLLPAPLVRRNGEWHRRAGLVPVGREVLKVVTAFTVAHSVTLALSFAGFLLLPVRWVEATIALSVFAAAWNNLRPFLPGRAWVMALGFGLVHGLSFAGALRNLSLPLRARGLALASFNLGVEIGQIAIVATVLPLLYLGSKRAWYPRLVLAAGSLAIAWLALLWTIERATGGAFLPRF
jgi:hypothetical protein